MGQHESIHEFSGTFLIFLRRHSSTVSLGPRADLGSRTVKDSSTSLDFHNKSMFALNVTVGSLRPLTVYACIHYRLLHISIRNINRNIKTKFYNKENKKNKEENKESNVNLKKSVILIFTKCTAF